MTNVTSQFIGDRRTFLNTKIVLVGEPVDKSNGPRKFWFDDKGSYATLKAGSPGASEDDKTTVNAYWLSWDPGRVAPLDVGGGADYFFTSHMTGCIFKVLTASATAPKVAHIPGTMNRSVQLVQEQEIVATIPEVDRAIPKVLSIQGSDQHKYRGQSGRDKHGKPKAGSAFVYGCKDGSGNWTFEAQIVKANLADEFTFKNEVRVNGVPRIANLFEFK